MQRLEQEGLKTVMLYGHLGRAFGRVHRFAVNSPREAVSALCANFPGFRKYLIDHSLPGYHVQVNVEAQPLEKLDYPSGVRETIRIIPVVEGSGRNVALIIIGVALAIMAPGIGGFIGATLGPGTGMAATIASFASTVISTIGISMALQGVSSLLFKPPKQDSRTTERPENQPSYAFDGPVNTMAQGHPVPVCYGRLIVGSQVISAGLAVEQI